MSVSRLALSSFFIWSDWLKCLTLAWHPQDAFQSWPVFELDSFLSIIFTSAQFVQLYEADRAGRMGRPILFSSFLQIHFLPVFLCEIIIYIYNMRLTLLIISSS